MKNAIAIIIVFGVIMGSVAEAQTYTWTGGGANNDWSTSGNWSSGSPTSSTTTSVIMNHSTQSTSDVDSAYTLSALTFSSTLGTFALSGSTISLQGPGNNYTESIIDGDSSGTVTINNNITLLAAAEIGTYLSGSDGTALTLAGTINNGGYALGFSTAGGSTITVNGIIQGAGAVGYYGGASTGTVILNGTNTYTGGSTIYQTTVEVGTNVLTSTNGALGNSAATINIGLNTGGSVAGLLTDGAYTVSRAIDIVSNTSGSANTITVGGVTTGTSTFSGNITLGTANDAAPSLYVTAASGGVVNISGNIVRASGATGTSDNLSKIGAGTVILSGTGNNYEGTTAIGAGTLLVTGTSTGGGAYLVESGAALGGAGGTITTASNAGVTVQAGGDLNISGAGLVTPGTLTLNLGSGSLNLSSSVTGSSASLIFDLGSVASSDKVLLGSGTGLNIGTGKLSLGDFSFTAATGFGAGTYVLFDTSSASEITGTLASSGLTGTVDGLQATLMISTDGSGYQDIDLVVAAVPEPSVTMLLLGGLFFFGFITWNNRRSALAIREIDPA